MKLWHILPLLLLLAGFPARLSAEPIIADISAREIQIDTSFAGTDLLLFGARNDPGEIAIVIRGPEHSYIVQKKERVAGIWVNRKQARFDNVSSFYTVASSQPLDKFKNANLLTRLGIGLDSITPPSAGKEDFRDALYAYKQKHNLFSAAEGEVSFIGGTLFRSALHFPDNIPRGDYTAEVYLFQDSALVGMQSTPLRVRKIGFDAVIYDLAYHYSALYGILGIILALGAGWVANLMFKNR